MFWKEEDKMNDVTECTRTLLEAIRKSQAYRDFEQSKKKIKEHPELKQKIDDFRKRVYLLQNSDSSLDVMDEMQRLYLERQELKKNVMVDEYLSSELRVCRMLQKISMEVMNVTDVELEPFEDMIKI